MVSNFTLTNFLWTSCPTPETTHLVPDDSFAFLDCTSLCTCTVFAVSLMPSHRIMTHFPFHARHETLNWQVTTNLTRSHHQQPQKQPSSSSSSSAVHPIPARRWRCCSLSSTVARYQFSPMIIIYNILPRHANPAMLARPTISSDCLSAGSRGAAPYNSTF